MNDFEALKQDYFHHVSCGPDEIKRGIPDVPYSDIVLHLPILEWYASKCKHIVEFGVRDAHSTVAFLSGLPKETSLLSIDIQESNTVRAMKKMDLDGKLWEFKLSSSIDPSLDIGSPDLIFFDTLHTYEHLDKELKLHIGRLPTYLAFHDTHTCWTTDRTGGGAEGIGRAIEENLNQDFSKNTSFLFQGETFYHTKNLRYGLDFETKWSNGLQIYKLYEFIKI